MDYLLVVLMTVVLSRNDACCDALASATVAEIPREDSEFGERNDSYAIESGSAAPRHLWRDLGTSRRNPRTEEPKGVPANGGASDRKSRLLGSLAFLAGLGFGGLATAASSTVKTIARLPQASLALSLASPKDSPLLAAYYNPYSLLPYPFLYPFRLAPAVDHPATKLQTTSHNDGLTPQVIGVFANGRPIDLAESGSGEEYETDAERKPDNGAAAGPDRRAESRAEADRNAEEKTRGCKEDQRKHGNYFGGSAGQRKDLLQVDANQSRQISNAPAANATGADANQTVTNNATMPTTVVPPPPPPPPPPTYYPPPYPGNHTTSVPHFPGYYDGHPQDISHVDLTAGGAYQYNHDYNQLNYNLPYERPASFYHNDRYSAYAPEPHVVNPYLRGSFASDQINEYVGADFNRPHAAAEYQPPSYAGGFRPAK